MERGMNVITSAEEMAYPQAQEPELAAKLDEIARRTASPCWAPASTRPYHGSAGHPVDRRLRERGSHRLPPGEQPVSLRPRRHEEAGYRLEVAELRSGRPRHHDRPRGFAESIRMITDALGWKLDKFEQDMEPIVTDVDPQVPLWLCRRRPCGGRCHEGWGTVDGQVKIEMDHPQQIEPEQVASIPATMWKFRHSPGQHRSILRRIEAGIGTWP